MHNHILIPDSVVTPPKGVRAKADELIAGFGPRDAAIIEIDISRKDRGRRRRVKTLQILVKGPGEAYYHPSRHGDLWNSIESWRNVLIPKHGLWCSIDLLVRGMIFDLARVKNIDLAEFAVSYEVSSKVVRDIASIAPVKSGDAADEGGFTVVRESSKALKNTRRFNR